MLQRMFILIDLTRGSHKDLSTLNISWWMF